MKKHGSGCIENPEEAAEILAKEADMPLEVAKKSLERNDFSDPIPGEKQIEALKAAGEVLQSENVIKENVDIEKIVEEMIIDRFSKKVSNEIRGMDMTVNIDEKELFEVKGKKVG